MNKQSRRQALVSASIGSQASIDSDITRAGTHTNATTIASSGCNWLCGCTRKVGCVCSAMATRPAQRMLHTMTDRIHFGSAFVIRCSNAIIRGAIVVLILISFAVGILQINTFPFTQRCCTQLLRRFANRFCHFHFGIALSTPRR